MRFTVRNRITLGLVLVAVLAFVVGRPANAATFTVTNTNDSGAGSLRQALLDANAVEGVHVISFNIPGTGPFVITPATALPSLGNASITNPQSITLDGCSQPGSICTPTSTALQIQIDGRNVGANTPVVNIFKVNDTNGGMTVRGLSITNGPAYGIQLSRTAFNALFQTPSNATIEYNYVGLKPDGTAAPNANGVALASQAGQMGGNNNHVAYNVIGGNAGIGLRTNIPTAFNSPVAVTGLVIENNIIGLDPTGTLARSNGGGGMQVQDTSGGIVRNNVIASNTGVGMLIQRTNANLSIQNNTVKNNSGQGINVGTPTTGSLPNFVGPATVYGNTITGNGADGIATVNASSIAVGGTGAGQANTITNNVGRGVVVGTSTADTSQKVTIRANSISGNGNLGIDLAKDGVTANGTSGVTRTGPNIQLNYPVLRRVSRGPTTITGTYAGPANMAITLDFYATSTADPSGHGQGGQWLGSTNVTTNSGGAATYNATFATTIPAGWAVSATATDPNGNTSEFTTDTYVGPTVQDQNGNTTAENPVTLNVLANATPGDAAITPSSLRLVNSGGAMVTSITTPSEGTFVANANGTITFTPAAGFIGATTPVQYLVYDANGAISNTATITVQVAYRSLVANDDTFSIPVDGGTAGNVLLNDTLQGSPVDAGQVTTTLLNDAGSGATIDSIGKVTIPANTPAATYPLQYKICEINYPTNCSQATATVTVLPLTAVDSDNDGIMDQVENDGPNGGDANQDGIPDRFEKNVATFVGTVTGRYKTLLMDSVCQITAADMITEPTNPVDVGFTYPMGLMNFVADCGTPGFTATVTQYYFDTTNANYILRKYDTNNNQYFSISSATLQPFSMGGRSALKAIFTLTDGGSLDMDGSSNGTIVDPAGLALATTLPSPAEPTASSPMNSKSTALADTGENMVAIGLTSLLSVGLSTGLFIRRRRALRSDLW